MNKNTIKSDIFYFQNKLSEMLDTAIDCAKSNFTDSARTFFEIAMSYKIQVINLESELNKIEKKEEEEFKNRLKIQLYKEENEI